MDPVIVVHGGAAIIENDRIYGKLSGVQNAVQTGYNVLKNGGNATDAVVSAIENMENNEYFNAGYGSVLNLDGEVEMDASIMDGRTLRAGACAIIKNISNPIKLANLIREKSFHVLLAGSGASDFAQTQKMQIIQGDRLISEYSKHVLEVFIEEGGKIEHREMGGTVGCVALDQFGNVAAGTSTGGTNGKLKGRIGDTPLIGCGTYADNKTGAVSCTGDGEAIITCCTAFSIIKDMEYGMSAENATKNNVNNLMSQARSTGGAITISKSGDFGINFNTKMMPWACIKHQELTSGYKHTKN